MLTCQASRRSPKNEKVDLALDAERTPFLSQTGVYRAEVRPSSQPEGAPEPPPPYTKNRFPFWTKPASCRETHSRAGDRRVRSCNRPVWNPPVRGWVCDSGTAGFMVWGPLDGWTEASVRVYREGYAAEVGPRSTDHSLSHLPLCQSPCGPALYPLLRGLRPLLR